MTRSIPLAAVTLVCLLSPVLAQAPTPPAAPRRPRPAAARIVVRNVSGTPLEGVRVTVSGGGSGEFTTDATGAATAPLAAGTYRLRFERDGFVTFEREVKIAPGQPAEIAVVLSAAPPPPAPPEPEPPPPPPAPAAPSHPVGAPASPVTVSVPTFLDKNFIGREPLKESILSCTPDATIRLLQLRDSVAVHAHEDVDEFVYVVAGDGAVRIGDEATVVAPGSLSVIPRSTSHAIERRGRNPLILLSTLAGAPCPSGSTAVAQGK